MASARAPRTSDIVATVVAATGAEAGDVAALTAGGTERAFAPGAWLFHESAPREWLGFVVTGSVELVRGLHGEERVIAVLGPGEVLAVGLLFDDSAHLDSARTRAGATVLTVPRAAVGRLRDERPDAYYRVAARVARVLGKRLRLLDDRLVGAGVSGERRGVRREHDMLGEREVPAGAYWGIQTLRATENFAISGVKLHQFWHLVQAFALVKKAAALANGEVGGLPADRRDAIVAACDEVAAGGLRDQFVVDMIQGGAGTSTNMNVNEVIANRALEILGHERGDYAHLHPNDDVNRSQSTNDAYPTAVKLGLVLASQDTIAALGELSDALAAKGREFADVVKLGRTEMQDAVPMTLGQEFSSWATTIGEASRALDGAVAGLLNVNLGATAIGTGINAPPGYAEAATAHLAAVSGVPVRLAADLVEATQDAGEFLGVSGALKRAAVQLSKVCNDLRLLSSGPRAGLGEVRLPAVQPGSTIMPGKVNPVMPEVVNQVCFQLVGYDTTVTMAAESGQLELNMAEPIMAYDLMHGLMILKNACITLTARCIVGIEADRAVCRGYVERSIGVVTALNPVLGYERSVAIATEALATGRGVTDLVLERGWLDRARLDELLSPEAMADPRQAGRPEGERDE
jgi:aspartate ammonia-lyase